MKSVTRGSTPRVKFNNFVTRRRSLSGDCLYLQRGVMRLNTVHVVLGNFGTTVNIDERIRCVCGDVQ